jgi:hypothetical protein
MHAARNGEKDQRIGSLDTNGQNSKNNKRTNRKEQKAARLVLAAAAARTAAWDSRGQIESSYAEADPSYPMGQQVPAPLAQF